MDSLTHGLLGLAIGSLRRPDGERNAVLVACVLAAELPDLDYFVAASDPVLHALKAHRGLSHSLVAAPVVALAAALLSKLLFRSARLSTVYLWSVPAALVGHLLADAWTGWGTRLFLPFSQARITLDWMLVVDPLFTAPLLVAALWGWRRRRVVPRALRWGLLLASLYLGLRVAAKSLLTARVERFYPGATLVQVFPSWFGPAHWRYVAVWPERYAVGKLSLLSGPTEQARHTRSGLPALSATAVSNPTVNEALAWARYPLVRERRVGQGGTQLAIADLRYHLNGQPTLTFVIELDARTRVVSATLERGGSARSLLERFRAQ
jgi:inner membrane protein